MADPAYLQGKGAIEDTNYPATKLVGGWMQIGGQREIVGGVVTTTENRRTLVFEADGTGLQVSRNTFQGESVATETEMDFTWRYAGNNRWFVTLQVGTGKLVSLTPGYWQSFSKEPAEPVEYRYHDNRLYPESVPNTYVRMTEEAVKLQLARIRSILR